MQGSETSSMKPKIVKVDIKSYVRRGEEITPLPHHRGKKSPLANLYPAWTICYT